VDYLDSKMKSLMARSLTVEVRLGGVAVLGVLMTGLFSICFSLASASMFTSSSGLEIDTGEIQV
jgi:hypothetical protein